MDKITEKLRQLKQGGADLSMEEDLSIAIMNLVSLEEHLYFTAEKTGKDAYFDLMGEMREVRKKLMAKMLDSREGETWCISKHLLAATMRLMEVGSKLYAGGKKDEAKEMFDKAYQIYSLFWAVRLQLTYVHELKKNAAEKSLDQPWSKEDILRELVDCCKE